MIVISYDGHFEGKLSGIKTNKHVDTKEFKVSYRIIYIYIDVSRRERKILDPNDTSSSSSGICGYNMRVRVSSAARYEMMFYKRTHILCIYLYL